MVSLCVARTRSSSFSLSSSALLLSCPPSLPPKRSLVRSRRLHGWKGWREAPLCGGAAGPPGDDLRPWRSLEEVLCSFCCRSTWGGEWDNYGQGAACSVPAAIRTRPGRVTSKRPTPVDGGEQEGLLKVPTPVRSTWVCLPKTGS